MNKFFAMLKDSYREAVDGWIFLVMLILAGVIIVLVASMSAEPLPPERAIPVLLRPQSMEFVSPDKGHSDKQAQFYFGLNGSTVTHVTAKEPWNEPMKISLQAYATRPGAGGMEVDDNKNPTKPVEGAGFLVNPFREAARYWAAPAGTPARQRPRYTAALGAEFLKHQIEYTSGLKIERVTPAEDNDSFVVETNGLVSRSNWPHVPSVLFGAFTLDSLAAPVGNLVFLVENLLLNTIGAWVLMIAGVIVTAGFIPNMLRKGAIDLFITKPISRPTILLYKYLGGLLFVFLLTSFTVAMVWLVIGIRTGVWSTGILLAIFGITFYFSILYACSTLFGVLSRNAIVCIVTTIVFWFILYVIGAVHNAVVKLDNFDMSETQAQIRAQRDRERERKAAEDKDKKSDAKDKEKKEEPEPDLEMMKPNPKFVKVMKTLNASIPRLNDLDALTTQTIARGLMSDADYKLNAKAATKVDWAEVIAVSCGWLVFFLGLATLRFVTRSY